MIMPEIKRIVRFEAIAGKTVKEVVEKGFALRLVFTDGSFADLNAETKIAARIVLEHGKPRGERRLI